MTFEQARWRLQLLAELSVGSASRQRVAIEDLAVARLKKRHG